MELNHRIFNQGEALIILHGLYGSSDNWISIAKKIDTRYHIVIPDLRNHGKSPHSPVHNYPAMAKDIKELADSLNLKKINIIGHSMGGKVAMTFACMYPELTNKLIIIDIAPKNYNMPEFQHHLISHRTIIDKMLNYSFEGKKSRTQIDKDFSHDIKDYATRQFILKNIKREEGAFKWKINIRSIHNNIHKILENSLKEEQCFRKPCLFIKGNDSDYILEEDMEDIKKTFPIAKLISIPDCGHWIHTEQPEILIETITKFLI